MFNPPATGKSETSLMEHQALARKWRPKTFAQMAGQEHVLRALINALNQGRLHHAYLFTGTRGVGKTTIARILAKALNCEQGVTATPCNECISCIEINEGRCIDLIEVDAASRTKVEDTRELLDNVQYAPARSRYKVYLIDEVHMLSGHSFNALLKTLEEPPPHVKFLLATTDPQKLPVTVLSRCLQFNLKNLSPELIAKYLCDILKTEQVAFDDGALWQIGRAADGSMRDALSLTDQAIAYGNNSVLEADVSTMLGSVDRNRVFKILVALIANDANQLLIEVSDIANYSPNYQSVLEELISILHRLAVAQVVPAAVKLGASESELIIDLAKKITGEELQLFYQIALLGVKDLPLNHDQRAGLEMVLLRMLAFHPEAVTQTTKKKHSNLNKVTSEVEHVVDSDKPSATKITHTNKPATQALQEAKALLQGASVVKTLKKSNGNQVALKPNNIEPESSLDAVKQQLSSIKIKDSNELLLNNNEQWINLILKLNVKGMIGTLLNQCAFQSRDGAVITLQLDPQYYGLMNGGNLTRITNILKDALNEQVSINIHPVATKQDTPSLHQKRIMQQQLDIAKTDIAQDEKIQNIVKQFGATVDANSIKFIE